MATPPESTKISLRQRLRAYTERCWPQVADLDFRYQGAFACVDAHLPDGEVLPLRRLRYAGSARCWGFWLYLAGSGLYLDDPTTQPDSPLT